MRQVVYSVPPQNMHTHTSKALYCLDGYFSPQWLHIEMRGELTFFLKSKWHEIISPKNYGHGHCNETPLRSSDGAGGQV